MRKNIVENYKRTGYISEQDILTLKSRMNAGETEDYNTLFDIDEELEISPEQTQKGVEWLRNQMKTKRGEYRKHNPFNKEQERILDNFGKFTLIDFKEDGNGYFKWYVPIYCVYGGGSLFAYYCHNTNQITFYKL